MLERQDPIPPGVYWLEVPKGEQIPFDAWLRSVWDSIILHRVDKSSTPGHDWVLFEAVAPISRWGQSVRLGYPSVAPKGRDTLMEDTIEAEDDLDRAAKEAGFEGKGRFLRDVGVGVATGVIAGTILWIITRR